MQSIVLSADGNPVESYNAPCNLTYPQPCPSSTGAQTLTLPTTELSDGTHTLTLVATDAAGNQSTVASEQITVDNSPSPPPAETTTSITASTGTPGSGSGAGTGTPTAKATIHVSETLRGRQLVVHVSGRGTGRVRVSFTGRLQGRTVAFGAKIVAFKQGGLTVTFKLGSRTAAHAAIRIAAKLGHQLTITSTLRRSLRIRDGRGVQ